MASPAHGAPGQQQFQYQPQQQPPPPQPQQPIQYAPHAYHAPGPVTGMPPPPPSTMTAPPAASANYQGYVKGLNGWNDPPSLLTATSRKHPNATSTTNASSRIDTAAVLASVENPISHVLGGLTAAMDRVKSVVISDPIQRKVLEDTDKRLEELLERLSEQAVPDVLLAHLVVLATALNASDLVSAKRTTMTLTLMSTEHHEDAHWIVGAKRLVEMFERVIVAPPQQFTSGQGY
ncbi:hypothetical protein HDU83_004757 [Entophlyctis luteolus]|nr:hypothetical protein HDU83_004757 [Entophlyctis luteolus]